MKQKLSKKLKKENNVVMDKIILLKGFNKVLLVSINYK